MLSFLRMLIFPSCKSPAVLIPQVNTGISTYTCILLWHEHSVFNVSIVVVGGHWHGFALCSTPQNARQVLYGFNQGCEYRILSQLVRPVTRHKQFDYWGVSKELIKKSHFLVASLSSNEFSHSPPYLTGSTAQETSISLCSATYTHDGMGSMFMGHFFCLKHTSDPSLCPILINQLKLTLWKLSRAPERLLSLENVSLYSYRDIITMHTQYVFPQPSVWL